jgi:predicted GH43/DUF377 family glycosyl hydrolase
VIDWARETDIAVIDPRVVQWRETNAVRLTFASHLRVVWCGPGTAVSEIGAAFCPLGEYETYGVEDPRVTWIDDRYWITYVAVSQHGAATALASTTDFRAFERHGIIFPPENKDVVLFPSRIGGRFAALHRPNGATPFTAPEMWIAYSDDLIHWGDHRPLGLAQEAWSAGRVGAGCPPIRFEENWLELYHGNQRPPRAGEVGRYVGAAMILRGDDPAEVLYAPAEPLLEPFEPYEREGFVPNVVFPTGIVQRDQQTSVYYGAADCHTAVATTDTHMLYQTVRQAKDSLVRPSVTDPVSRQPGTSGQSS